MRGNATELRSASRARYRASRRLERANLDAAILVAARQLRRFTTCGVATHASKALDKCVNTQMVTYHLNHLVIAGTVEKVAREGMSWVYEIKEAT